MENRTSYYHTGMLVLLLIAMVGCTGSKATVESEPDQEAVVEGDNTTEGHRSGGVAGVVGETVGWKDTISGDIVDSQPFSMTEQLLHGQVAGVNVQELPGGGFSVRIRGTSSIMMGTEPLYVVDGMPVLNTYRGGISWLNIRDIDKIEVLKDISAKALYGSRGSNGVVLITTKLGPPSN